MRRFLFWSIAILLLASAAHIVTSVFFPRLEREEAMALLMGASKVNSLTVIEDEKKAQAVLRGLPADMAVAVCPYDISKQPLAISAPLPGSYWAISIFEPGGRNIYTLNDQQVGTDLFNALIMQGTAKTAADEGDEQRQGDGVIIRAEKATGVVVIRTFVTDRAARVRANQFLAQTRCAPGLATAAKG